MATKTVIVLLLSQSLPLALAAPLTTLESELLAANGNKTLLNSEIAPSWATTSNIRSTSDLLWTCVLTLTICIYTVIHVNVPRPGDTERSNWLSKVKLAVCALLAPELVLMAALGQWSTARALRRDLNSIYSKRSDGQSKGTPAEKFSMTYCFYAVMGGFVIDVSEVRPDVSVMALLPAGIVHLARKGNFIEMSEKTIKDKSKADLLAKSIVCIQVLWMVIQCIGRKIEGLPISLLEIHTLVHVACALCMYALWVNKPLDIQESTIVDSSRFPNDVALMVLRSGLPRGCHKSSRKLYDPHPSSAESISAIRDNDENRNPLDLEENPVTNTNDFDTVRIINSELTGDITKRVEHVHWKGSGTGRHFTLNAGHYLNCGLGMRADIKEGAASVELSVMDLFVWTRATAAMQEEPDKYLRNAPQLYVPKEFMVWRSSNFQDISFNSSGIMTYGLDLGSYLFWVMLIGLPMVYGSVHLAAWNFEFPTHTERLMWRIACTIIAGGIPGALLISFTNIFGNRCLRFVGRRILGQKILDWQGSAALILLSIFGLIIVLVLAAFYLSCRIFVIIESFISVRRQPLGVFLTVDWSTYIPHL